jgi:hypothetical protein
MSSCQPTIESAVGSSENISLDCKTTHIINSRFTSDHEAFVISLGKSLYRESTAYVNVNQQKKLAVDIVMKK